MAAEGKLAAIFQGVCTGHGKASGAGAIWATVAPCSPGNLESIPARPYPSGHDLAGSWLPTNQLPKATPLATTVRINGKVPIVDKDELTPHPTLSVYQVVRTKGDCTITAPANAWHCHAYTGLENVKGREPATGHARKCFATCKSVLINGHFAGRMGDPLGNLTTAYPCRSTIAGASTNVFIGV